jgi:hypothetical protein
MNSWSNWFHHQNWFTTTFLVLNAEGSQDSTEYSFHEFLASWSIWHQKANFGRLPGASIIVDSLVIYTSRSRNFTAVNTLGSLNSMNNEIQIPF